MRVAAVADIHTRADHEDRVREMFADVRHRADVLVLAGDITDHGRLAEGEALLKGLRDVGIPVLAVFGNHDHEAGSPEELLRMMRGSGIVCLDRASHVIGDVGFAGAKGFGGGFGDRLVRGFGEDATKAFVAESVIEAEALRTSLHALQTPRKFAVLHYAPIADTVAGEPLEIHPFLGTTRLADAVDEGGANVVIHGHAHHGTLSGRTLGGVPVWNVSLPVLRASGIKEPYFVIEV